MLVAGHCSHGDSRLCRDFETFAVAFVTLNTALPALMCYFVAGFVALFIVIYTKHVKYLGNVVGHIPRCVLNVKARLFPLRWCFPGNGGRAGCVLSG